MISAKVDFLQLLVVKATVGRLAVGERSILDTLLSCPAPCCAMPCGTVAFSSSVRNPSSQSWLHRPNAEQSTLVIGALSSGSHIHQFVLPLSVLLQNAKWRKIAHMVALLLLQELAQYAKRLNNDALVSVAGVGPTCQKD